MEKRHPFFGNLIRRRVSRKDFLRLAVSALAFLPFAGTLGKDAAAEAKNFNGRVKRENGGAYDLAVGKGDDPYAVTVKAVEAMGGMERFVAKDARVVVKPNIGWDRSPEQAGNTNPQVVAALVDLSFKAGAQKVKVFDITCNDQRRCYDNSGIERIAKEHGAEVFMPDEWDVVKARFPYPSQMEGWPILREAIECDTFINVPVAKHHGLTRLTLSMKNLMGVCGDNRGIMHRDIGPKLVDLTDFISPDLTVIDAYRVLLRNGPTGGDLNDVELKKTIVVATDPTLADLYACRLMGVDPAEVPYVRTALSRQFGRSDIDAAKTIEVTV